MSKGLKQAADLSRVKRELLSRLMEKEGIDAEGLKAIPRRGASGPSPLSFAQERLWFFEKLEPGTTAYNINTAVRLSGRLNVSVLGQSLSEIVRRHEVLRSSFTTVDEKPMQIASPPPDIALPVTDLRALPPAEREAEALRHAAEEARRPFDLTQSPLLRSRLLQLDDEEYVALVTMPHVVSDGWSVDVLVRELAALYNAGSVGKPSSLPELPIQYADYAAWQRQGLRGEAHDEQLSYWRRQLEGAPANLNLPTARPRPQIQTFRGKRHSLVIPAPLGAKLRELSRREGATLFMTLLAAFKTLLCRYSGQKDICVGTPVANRNRPELEVLIGLFLNTLVMRTDLSGDPTFSELLARERDVAFGAFEHQDLPFEKLVEELRPERDLGRHPLFQVAFALRSTQMQGVKLSGLVLQPIDVDSGTAKFDLTLYMLDTERELLGTLEYNTDLFDGATIESMARHFEILLTSVAENPGLRLSALPLLTETEREQILVGWNSTARDYPLDSPLHSFVEASARRTPRAVALSFRERHLTYVELNERANRLAHFLRAQGVTPDTAVALLMERSVEMVVALLGVLKAGGAYMPLDPSHPPQRLSAMLSESRARVLLTQSEVFGRVPLEHPRVLRLDADWGLLEAHSADEPRVALAPGNLAYIIHTSGSTGVPKGVMNTHEGIVNRLVWMQDEYGLKPSDAVLQKTPYGFDVSVWEFFWPLMAGARLVVAEPGGHQDASYLADLVRREGVTVLHFVPSMLQAFLEVGRVGEACAGLRHVVCSGEALGAQLVRSYYESGAGGRLHNLYGPTEAAVDVTSHRCEPRDGAMKSVPIGRPIANTRIYVLDDHLEPMSVGVVGELYIAGVGLARGYLAHPELTAERFMPDPHDAGGCGRMYRTGDVARYLAGGEIEYVGRGDGQVKVHGQRIELGEIEATLRLHPAVSEGVVVVHEGEAGQKQLVAYLVPQQQQAYTVRQLCRLEREGNLTKAQEYELPNGMVVSCLNKKETDFLYEEIFTDSHYLRHGITLAAGACIFDVGANIGMFALFAGSVCRDAVIYAFEPLPPIYEALHANAELYDFNIKLFNCGLSSRSRRDTFTFYPHLSLMSGRFADVRDERETIKAFEANRRPVADDSATPGGEELFEELLDSRLKSEEFTCELKTISEVMREEGVERIDLLKIDVEKSELDVLDGIAEEDWEKIRQVVVEVHDVGGRLGHITALLRHYGFDATSAQDEVLKSTNIYNVYAARPTAAHGPPDGGDAAAATAGPELEKWHSPRRLVSDVQDLLKQKLPSYMMPAAFVLLDKLPLTPNGKLDVRSLPKPESSATRSEKVFVAPHTEVERALAEIWAGVLGRENIGTRDNFFEAGGDSIMAVQITARANRAGLRLTTKQIFEHPTIAGLAEVAEATGATRAEQGPVTGALPLTPIQHWFFEQDLPHPHHFNQALLLEISPGVEAVLLEQGVRALIEHHDALRLRFERAGAGWLQRHAGAAEPAPFSRVDFSGLPESEQGAAVEAYAKELQGGLNLSAGPLLRVAFFDLAGRGENRLLIVIHHLAIDGVSWKILLEDLQSAYQQLAGGKTIAFPQKTTSFKQWAERLAAFARSGALRGEVAYWLDEARSRVAPLAADFPTGANSEAAARTWSASLSTEETDALLYEVADAYRAHANDVFLTALLQAFHEWTGRRALLVDVEGHGREEILEDTDISRTAGWFTSIFPVLLKLPESSAPGDVLKSVKEQLRRIPHRGVGYGILRYLSDDPETQQRLRDLPQAEISFNYLGQFDQTFTKDALFKVAREQTGPGSSPHNTMAHKLDIGAVKFGGQLLFRIKYSTDIYRSSTIETFARGFLEKLRALIAHSRSDGVGGCSPSDFPLARLEQEELDKALALVETGAEGGGQNWQRVEDAYPLSPAQEGMLFHSVYAPDSGVYLAQLAYAVRNLDPSAVERAWQRVAQRHPVLRTAFVWENLKRPLQVVCRGVKLPIDVQDWRGLAPVERQERFETYLRADRERGFRLARAPMLRLALLRTGEDEYRFVWSFHHLLLDGWSMFLILKELFAFYEAYRQGQELSLKEARPYRDYIAWLQEQPLGEAEAYWREHLRGFTAPTPLGLKRVADAARRQHEGEDYGQQRIELPEEFSARLQAFARHHHLTLNTLMQGAWALLLSHYSGLTDIVFGATTSNRPPELPGIEAMVGLFLNVLPRRVRLPEEGEVLAWLKRLQEEQAETREYDYTPLAQVQRWSEVPPRTQLFQSILSFDNYPVDSSVQELSRSLSVSDTRYANQTNFPVTVISAPGAQIPLQVVYDRRLCDDDAIARLLEHFQTLLQNFMGRPRARIRELREALVEREKGWRSSEQKKQGAANRTRFQKIKPKAVSLPRGELVETSYLETGETLPLVMRPAVAGLDLADWARGSRERIAAELRRHGAILLRGFNVDSANKFEEFAQGLCPDLFGEYGDLPREGVSGKVYGSTPYPSDKAILFHNESSHMHRWPLKIWFYCVKAAEQGGETPIADCRKVYRLLDPQITERFARRRLVYVRNYIAGLDVSWQNFFRTNDRSTVEDYCRRAGIEWEWVGEDDLRTREVRDAVTRHPHTGEMIFFNQLQLHHISCLEPAVRESLMQTFREEELPRNVYYADGAPVEDSIMQEIGEVYHAASRAFPWRETDILLLDNMLVAHARNPFVGQRKILVAMGEMATAEGTRLNSQAPQKVGSHA